MLKFGCMYKPHDVVDNIEKTKERASEWERDWDKDRDRDIIIHFDGPETEQQQ